MKKIKTILGVILLLIIISACSSKKNVIQDRVNIVTNENFDKSKASKSTSLVLIEKGICVTTDKTDSDPNIVISSGKCVKDE